MSIQLPKRFESSNLDLEGTIIIVVNNMRLDLNLLVVIEAIMLERNVTRAAASLSMSQPAVSNALRRARKLTHDQLFLKVADGVQPTSRMLAIWPELHRSLAVIRASIAPEQFDPRSDPTSFRIAVTDSLAEEAVCGIALKLRAMSPYARLAFSFHTNASSLEGIERGTLDCAVGMFPSLPRDIHVQGLRTDHYMCVMRRGHALEGEMDLDQFVAASHVLVTPSGMDLGVIDGWLSLHGRTRTIAVVVNHFVDALRIVAGSDLMTCVPSGFINGHGRSLVSQHGLVVRHLPFEAEKLVYKLVWHERVHTHPAHQWFRSLVAGICGNVGADNAG
ncbi:LysR family transcriptional regulator (plasmid) [Rhizobium sp. CB3060]|uniref:LysR family transcriptional regulator n=1 Tax=unclassified Rhizobium TaxID=2613769 RepID=UPI0021A4B902|nr:MULTISPECIES: LysR family transcriptional regulator [Rhizobium]MDK4742904.1 LysR family transcriptional regulator [Rhizobium sp. CNPSo 3464]UWU23903.1 LysR family transcriptional regulator [Rhizobium tropici]